MAYGIKNMIIHLDFFVLSALCATHPKRNDTMLHTVKNNDASILFVYSTLAYIAIATMYTKAYISDSFFVCFIDFSIVFLLYN